MCKEKGDKKNKITMTEKNLEVLAKSYALVAIDKATDYTKPKKSKVDPEGSLKNFFKYETV